MENQDHPTQDKHKASVDETAVDQSSSNETPIGWKPIFFIVLILLILGGFWYMTSKDNHRGEEVLSEDTSNEISEVSPDDHMGKSIATEIESIDWSQTNCGSWEIDPLTDSRIIVSHNPLRLLDFTNGEARMLTPDIGGKGRSGLDDAYHAGWATYKIARDRNGIPLIACVNSDWFPDLLVAVEYNSQNNKHRSISLVLFNKGFIPGGGPKPVDRDDIFAADLTTPIATYSSANWDDWLLGLTAQQDPEAGGANTNIVYLTVRNAETGSIQTQKITLKGQIGEDSIIEEVE